LKYCEPGVPETRRHLKGRGMSFPFSY